MEHSDNPKATTPVAVLLASWSLGVAPPNLKTLGNVSFIVIGIVIASFGEIKFVLIGFLYQVGGIAFEAIRLTMVQRLLSSSEFKMDPLVSLYYFAPACAVMNGVVALVAEVPTLKMADIYNVGLVTLLANASVAFMLNVAVVFLVRTRSSILFWGFELGADVSLTVYQIGKTSSLVLTLSGVLKDILLVVASMVIFRDPVSLTQMVGYGIALSGLIYYRLGADKLKEYFGQGSRSWAEYRATRPATAKLIVFAVVMTILFIVLGGLAPYVPSSYRQTATDKINHIIASGQGRTGGS